MLSLLLRPLEVKTLKNTHAGSYSSVDFPSVTTFNHTELLALNKFAICVVDMLAQDRVTIVGNALFLDDTEEVSIRLNPHIELAELLHPGHMLATESHTEIVEFVGVVDDTLDVIWFTFTGKADVPFVFDYPSTETQEFSLWAWGERVSQIVNFAARGSLPGLDVADCHIV